MYLIEFAITPFCHCHLKSVHLKSAEFFSNLHQWASKATNNNSVSMLLYATKRSQHEISSISSLMKGDIISVYLAICSYRKDLKVNQFGRVSVTINNRTWSRFVRNHLNINIEELTDSQSEIYMLNRLKNDLMTILATRFKFCYW